MAKCKRSCPAYSNYQPPYEECTCGADNAKPTVPVCVRCGISAEQRQLYGGDRVAPLLYICGPCLVDVTIP